MHLCARLIEQKYHGEFPTTYAQLRELPGIGDYTARAILSLAYEQDYLLVDANVKRVIRRLFLLEVWSRSFEQNYLSSLPSLSAKDKRYVNEGIMRLGQEICLKAKPLCLLCPLKEACLAYKEVELSASGNGFYRLSSLGLLEKKVGNYWLEVKGEGLAKRWIYPFKEQEKRPLTAVASSNAHPEQVLVCTSDELYLSQDAEVKKQGADEILKAYTETATWVLRDNKWKRLALVRRTNLGLSASARKNLAQDKKANHMNSVVIDFKDDMGWVLWRSENALAKEMKAVRPILDVKAIRDLAEEMGIYLIARFVVFKDQKLYHYKQGVFLLFYGSHYLVSGSSLLARKLGVSPLLIGLTVVAVGTSAPELFVSLYASWQGLNDITLAFGSDLLVRGARYFAGEVFGISERVIGLTLVAIGTSLPELLTSLVAVFKKELELSVVEKREIELPSSIIEIVREEEVCDRFFAMNHQQKVVYLFQSLGESFPVPGLRLKILQDDDLALLISLCQEAVSRGEEFLQVAKIGDKDDFFKAFDIVKTYFNNEENQKKEKADLEQLFLKNMQEIADKLALVPGMISPDQISRLIGEHSKYFSNLSDFKPRALAYLKTNGDCIKYDIPILYELGGSYIHRKALFPYFKKEFLASSIKVKEHLVLLARNALEQSISTIFTSQVSIEKEIAIDLSAKFPFVYEMLSKPKLLSEFIFYYLREVQAVKNIEEIKQTVLLYAPLGDVANVPLVEIYNISLEDIFEKAYRSLSLFKKLWYYIIGRYHNYLEKVVSLDRIRTEAKLLSLEINNNKYEVNWQKSDQTSSTRSNSSSRRSSRFQTANAIRKKLYTKSERDKAWREFSRHIKDEKED
ncbi:UNVERIFIED_CONTAM: hypothetical protein PYX00_010939 [Menopon gallinae]|uniref:Adenine DNA glycosylase n=1 Tax=Menopon gallinae TaxID=328185 RepID=A0AAW2H765_9NEOP